MKKTDIARLRLQNQGLLASSFQKPEEVVKNLCAVQSQDYNGGLWALGLRLPAARQKIIAAAFDTGKILRTHLLRPTWHFIVPEDIRWLLMLTAPRVSSINKHYYRKAELDENIFAHSHKVIEKSLRDAQQLTRAELRTKFVQAGIPINDNLQMSLLMMHAELAGLVCSGAQRGKQFTYMLLEERAPAVPAISRDEALAEIIWRYFSTRGPATLQDFAWWSGLTMTDAKRGVEIVQAKLLQTEIEQQTYWFTESAATLSTSKLTAHLLPNFDEYFIGFKDRSAINLLLPQSEIDKNLLAFGGNILIVNEQVVGTWKRTLKNDAAVIEWNLVIALKQAEQTALAQATELYGAFLQFPVSITTTN